MRRMIPSPHWALAAVMTVSLALAAASGLALQAQARLAGAQEQALGLERIARVLAPEGQAGLREARAALSRSPDVREARILTAEDAEALLTGWAQGEALPAEALDDLRLIAFRLEATAPPDAAERLQADLADQGVSIEVAEPGPAARAQARGRTGGADLLWAGLALLAAAAVIGFAARAAAAEHKDAARLLAGLGASRAQAQGLLSRPIAGAGFAAGLAAALIAAGGWAAAAAALPGAEALRPSAAAPLSLMDIAPLAAAPVIGFLAARSGARAGAGRAFDAADFAL